MSIPASSDRPDLFKVWLGLPPRSLMQFPPAPNPPTLPPPAVEHSWLQPFTVPADLFHATLDVRVPITIAAVYAVSVILMNRVNKSRDNKPWAISKTRLFKLFVILHNVFLAVYSAWTFIGMTRAFRASLPAAGEKPRLVNTVDALCHINGPRGLGNAAVYDPQSEQWTMMNPEYHLTDGAPDQMDVGRLWNSGLAFFGWLFYLSKFYEVLDTVIILAKGKKSSTLQTYHHAGAMMCMWAGIRFMAAPIWIFAIFNSLIHALMYTYYTLTAVRVRVPNRIKRSLTTMQIIQFIIGCSLAAVHLFVYYSIPVAVPHSVALRPNAPTPSPAAAANDSDSLSWLKKLAFRAAGAQGVAENVANANGSLFGVDGAQAVQAALNHQEIRYTLEPRTFTCMSTSGQTFAVWLNVLYLLPLTFLFARFFVRSYLRRSDPSIKHPSHGTTAEKAEKAGMDALKGVTREIRNAVDEMHGGIETEPASGSTTDADVPSGTTTPHNHPEAYEACINTIMTKQQRQVERRASAPEKHPVAPKYAQPASQPRTTPKPSNVPGAKSYSDALQSDL